MARPEQPHLFRCVAGHELRFTASTIERKTQRSCLSCQAARRLRQLRQKAESNGVRCLSTEWTGTAGPYLFECAQSHQWQHGARLGPACPQCGDQGSASARRVSQDLQRLRQAAAARGGKCPARPTPNGNARYRFRCTEGHEWEAQGSQAPRVRILVGAPGDRRGVGGASPLQ